MVKRSGRKARRASGAGVSIAGVQPSHPRNLTAGVFRGGGRPVDLYRRIKSGIGGRSCPPPMRRSPTTTSGPRALRPEPLAHGRGGCPMMRLVVALLVLGLGALVVVSMESPSGSSRRRAATGSPRSSASAPSGRWPLRPHQPLRGGAARADVRRARLGRLAGAGRRGGEGDRSGSRGLEALWTVVPRASSSI